MTGRLLAITGGHRFDLDALRAMLDGVCDCSAGSGPTPTQPAAQRWLRPEHAGDMGRDRAATTSPDWRWRAAGAGAERPVARDAVRRCSTCSTPGRASSLSTTRSPVGRRGTRGRRCSAAGSSTRRAAARRRGPGFRLPDGPLPGRRRRAEPSRCARASSRSRSTTSCTCARCSRTSVTPLLTTPAETAAESMIDTYREVVTANVCAAAPQPAAVCSVGRGSTVASRIVYLLPGHGPARWRTRSSGG